jgi:hypothetical protein
MPTMKALFRWAFPVIATIMKRFIISTSFRIIEKYFRQIYNIFFNKRLPFSFFWYQEAKKTIKWLRDHGYLLPPFGIKNQRNNKIVTI